MSCWGRDDCGKSCGNGFEHDQLVRGNAPEIAEQRRESEARLDAFWDRLNAEPTGAEECLDILRAELGLTPEQRWLEEPDPFDNSMGLRTE